MKKVLAFDIGGTNSRVALINENFEVEDVKTIPTVRDSNGDFLKSLDDLASQFDLTDVVAFGCGLPGVINRENGFIYDLPNVHVKSIPFGEFMKNKYKVPVFVRNDAEVACLAEAVLGAGKEYQNVFFITISTGLGGALVIDEENQDYITEIGHTAYKYKDKVYEYEYLASGTGIVNLANINGLKISNAKELFNLVSKQDIKAIEVYNEWMNIINDFIVMIQDSYEPDIICVTGGVMKAKQFFFASLLADNPQSNIVECYFKEEAGLMGAAAYAFKKMKII